MNVLLTSPYFPAHLEKVAKALKNHGVNVLGVGDMPYDELTDTLKGQLTEYFKVNNLEDTAEVTRAVAFLIYKHGPIDRIESNNEHWLVLDATLREQFNVPGVKPADLTKTMYKSKMKKLFKQAGVPVVPGELVTDLQSLDKAIKTLGGLPLIAKPDHGVGTSATYKLEHLDDVARFKRDWTQDVPYFLEPFVSDAELCTYDGLIGRDNQIIYETTFYYNTPTLDHIQGDADYAYTVESEMDSQLRQYGRAIIKAFGMSERFFHIELFRKSDGEYVALEYNNRSAGGHSIDLYNYAISADLYDIYAKIVTGQLTDIPTFTGRYAASISRRDHVQYVHSDEEIRARYGEAITMHERLPDIFSDIMGDEVYVILSDSRTEADEMTAFIHKRVEHKEA
ncbi:carbamoyl phosphate synthase large subunit [Dolosigranulum pigrum]|uniref:ATP-grasp domain-containing protein n=1 Tax=Dolosigranulum pigrum TaxID=29394 RepID=UPI001AD87491|nr:carbamoyl phosphate synthase large subunit [Dolosigranulum pigrum]QTJ40315.1 carbamoyl phosphate synthase large subunit [Dolosigranulum pigrum]QTJ48798.1 carbamoyl phosphate synthase large subunit [Dolosigranulum pigrum]